MKYFFDENRLKVDKNHCNIAFIECIRNSVNTSESKMSGSFHMRTREHYPTCRPTFIGQYVMVCMVNILIL